MKKNYDNLTREQLINKYEKENELLENMTNWKNTMATYAEKLELENKELKNKLERYELDQSDLFDDTISEIDEKEDDPITEADDYEEGEYLEYGWGM